jgi:hypothetical protein
VIRRARARRPRDSRRDAGATNEILADCQAGAVVEDYFQGFDVVVGFAGHYGVDSAGVVADHAADGAAVVTGGIGSEGEVMFFGGVAQLVENDSGLHASDAASGIDLEDRGHVLGKIEDDGDVAALAGERRSSATTEQRRAKVATDGNSGENILSVAGNDYANGNLAIVGSVGGVESTGAGIEADLAANVGAQRLCKTDRIER